MWWPAGDQRIVDESHFFARGVVVRLLGTPATNSILPMENRELVNKDNRKIVGEYFLILIYLSCLNGKESVD